MSLKATATRRLHHVCFSRLAFCNPFPMHEVSFATELQHDVLGVVENLVAEACSPRSPTTIVKT